MKLLAAASLAALTTAGAFAVAEPAAASVPRCTCAQPASHHVVRRAVRRTVTYRHVVRPARHYRVVYEAPIYDGGPIYDDGPERRHVRYYHGPAWGWGGGGWGHRHHWRGERWHGGGEWHGGWHEGWRGGDHWRHWR